MPEKSLKADRANGGDERETDELLTLAEICERYHVSDRRARDIVRQHGVPILQPGRMWLFDARAETAFREATRKVWSEPGQVEPVRGRGAKRSRGSSSLSDYEQALALCAEATKPRSGRRFR